MNPASRANAESEDELRALETTPGAFAGAPADFAGGDGWNTAWAGVSPSAWVYLARDGGLLVDTP